MPKSFLLIIISLLALTILSVFIVVVIPDKTFQEKEIAEVPTTLEEPPISFLDPILGNKNAKITIIEYGDFTCALCRSVDPELQKVIAEAPNKRRLIWKDAPNVLHHADAFTASMAARCAQDQGKFWDYHDQLMQPGARFNAQSLSNVAEQVGLNPEAFQNCMSSDVTRPIIQHTLDEAMALNLEGTPTIFINGVEYIGALTFEAIDEAISAL